jgi:superfamily II DNA or RNA helicase
MSLKDVEIKKSYDSDEDFILRDFYIPVLSNSIKYFRIAGFFSSSALAVAARGLAKFIENGGYMELIASAKLRKEDVEAIKQGIEDPEKIIENNFIKDVDEIEDEFTKDHVRALGWMIANNKLKIKIAILTDDYGNILDDKSEEGYGMFHPKIGIFEDEEGNMLSFSGSVNESATGWIFNREEFKVFRNWDEEEKPYFDFDYKRFKKFWDGNSKRTKILDATEAIQKKLIEIAPPKFEDLDLEKWIKTENTKKHKATKLWDHQKQAIDNWISKGGKGIFEMATGTGKTLAALGCLNNMINKEKKLITVITCPYDHLVKQWLGEIESFGMECDMIIADSSNPGWKDEIVNDIYDIENDVSDKLIILTTHDTFSSNDFISIMQKTNIKLFLIADEVHGLGAPERKKGMLDKYDYRLGLSATPKRYFDIEGTEKIFNYFGDTVFKFTLKEAINTINPDTGETYLTQYEYKPYFTEMTDEEFIKYEKETRKIARAYYSTKNNEEKEMWFNLLCIKRQEIVKNCSNKYILFNKILDEIGEVKFCLVYCSPQQIDKIQEILLEKNILQHKFTNIESVKPEEKYGGSSERSFLIKKFGEGVYDVLVAMKCLDEGIDIRPARIAILLSSSGNSREYIQRRGRVLRHFPGKKKAIIYDIIVVPTLTGSISKDFYDLERKILMKELVRYKDFADDAINTLECIKKIEQIEKKYNIIL